MKCTVLDFRTVNIPLPDDNLLQGFLCNLIGRDYRTGAESHNVHGRLPSSLINSLSDQMETMEDARMQKKVEEGCCLMCGPGLALRSKMKAKALKQCDSVLAKFTDCARGRTFSVVWVCREQHREMNECLKQFTNDEVFEEYKKQYVLEKGGK